MLEVNDFNAIRLTIASPDQIRRWSYGEVTKPETINYRTLKPEKDGLFCERIFGPTKDWECYCGKYKRVRFRGIVCDKCGVEVARAKVRRERMGHIELASPVMHIWYFKGIPSQMGLLLNLSPRNLEKVLYFASYIVTSVDEEARQRRLAELDEEVAEQATGLERATAEQQQAIESRVEQELLRLESETQAKLATLEERRGGAREAAQSALAQLEERLAQLNGQAPEEDLVFEPSATSVVAAGTVVTPEHIEAARDVAREYVEDVARQTQHEEQRAAAALAEAAEHLRGVANLEIDELARKMNEEIAAIESSVETRRQEIEKLQPMTLLTDVQYRELQEICGPMFRAGMGAQALLEIIQSLDLDALAKQLRVEVHAASTQRRKKAIKRLRVVEAFRRSGTDPAWMILTVLPVLPPDLRPMVQLDGGRFATSDLNDLYRRVINRNNRLKRLLDLGAPDIIIRNEKRMLQEAVDALVDNGRRGRSVMGSTNHKLKSLSDMLRGKQGRFRQNLLGKRVDYSGRSVIVVGPGLQIHQCGLPKRMALELFKPFVMRQLVERNYAPNIKSAKRIVERARPVVWDVLEEAIRGHPVLLNRAPTLHRLGIQAFEPVLVDGSAIQIHPLVCTAYNADFDGDTMSIHVPLSREAQREAHELMLSRHNLLSPADGSPLVAPTKDMVLGCYYLTLERPTARGAGMVFGDFDEVALAYEAGEVELQAPIKLQVTARDFGDDGAMVWSPPTNGRGSGGQHLPVGALLSTTAGRVIFNQALPPELRFENRIMDKSRLKELVARTFLQMGHDRTAEIVDRIKDVGFHFATVSGLTVGIEDITIPTAKRVILDETDELIDEIEMEYNEGLMTEREQYEKTVEAWTAAMAKITDAVQQELDPFGAIYLMAESGAAKGHFQQIRQLAGMRGLMAAPTGKIIPIPVRSNLREGLSVLEYFISTHGARKGLADTALRTADSGYLTRRLVDVAQDVIVREEDCGTTVGITVEAPPEQSVEESLSARILGRFMAEPIAHPETGEVLVEANELIDEAALERVEAARVTRATVRSPLTCESRHGVCVKCYGRNLADSEVVKVGTAVGIIAAQSIGEPGTQLTMRTFHTGGIAGEDITSGLPRVEELFEARVPKGMAIISAIDGKVEVLEGEPMRIRVVNTQVLTDTLDIPEGYEIIVQDGEEVEPGQAVAQRVVATERAVEPATDAAEAGAQLAVRDDGAALAPTETEQVVARTSGQVVCEGRQVIVRWEEENDVEYPIPATARIRVEDGQLVQAGDQLTEGPINPQDILAIQGPRAVQEYLVKEVQRVYTSQAVSINDKHIEVIIRQMLRKVRVDEPGDTDLLPGEIVDRFEYESANERVVAEGGEPATAEPVLLGITKSSLATESFLAAASFQETTRVLTEAAVQGKTDRLLGLKENVILGKLIPAGTGMQARLERQQRRLLEAGGDGDAEAAGDGALAAAEAAAAPGPVLFGQQSED